MRTARRRLTLFRIAAAPVLAAAAINLATGPALFGIPRWVSAVGLILLAVGLTYLPLSRTQPAAAEPSLDNVADRLAAAMDTRLNEELAVQDLNQRTPIAMRWRVADRPGKVRLSGGSTEIQAQVARRFNALRHRQVIVTGVAGAGKTVMAMWLTLGLNQCREPGDPVAVLVSIADWRPDAEHLRAWLVRQLTDDYGLTEATAESLVHQRIIPVLDGLDELPEVSRTAALHGIHKALGSGDPVAVTSRETEFDDARIGESLLPNVTRVDVEPVDRTEAAAFLRQGDDRGRWDAVIARIENEPDSVLAQVLSTPLTVWLAKTIYTGRDPAELLDSRRFDTAERLTEHLVAGLIPAAYRRPPAAPGIPTPASYDPDRAHGWLAFLAQHLNRLGTNELQWWRLYKAVPKNELRSSNALILATATAALSIPVLLLGTLRMAAFNMFLALLFGLTEDGRDERPLWQMRYSIRGRVVTLPRPTGLALFLGVILLLNLALVASILGYVLGVVVVGDSLQFMNKGLAAVVVVFSFTVVIAICSRVVRSTPLNTVHDLRADETLRSDRWVSLAELAVSVVIAEALVAGFLYADGTRASDLLEIAVPGLILIVLVGVWNSNSWYRYQCAKLALAVSGKLPWRLFRFLEDARRRGLLRRSSAAYQFRHALLQDHLASPRREPSA